MIFRRDYYFLSNMYPCSIKYRGLNFKCVESAFQGNKVGQLEYFSTLDGFQAKRQSRNYHINRQEWFSRNLQVMEEILTAKFTQHPELLERLKEIQGEIAEDNHWGDTFWGRCGGTGENHLGKILMKIRDSY